LNESQEYYAGLAEWLKWYSTCLASMRYHHHQKKSIMLSKRSHSARHCWLTPLILATQEAEIRRIPVQSQPQERNSILEKRNYKKWGGRMVQVVALV
jgi:hypothetical protein